MKQGRPKKKPDYNAVSIDKELLESAAAYYKELAETCTGTGALDREASYKMVAQTAEKFHVTPMKMRKLLITAGVYSTETSELIGELYAEGKSNWEIQQITGLKRSSVNGYLPYSKVIYNHTEKSVGAERIGLYRERQRLTAKLRKELSEKALRECFAVYENFLFYTASGLPFKYSVIAEKGGSCRKELLVEESGERKRLAWGSVMLVFQNVLTLGAVISEPKELGDIEGIAYIYPVFYKFGLIDVPDKVKAVMDGKNPKKAVRQEVVR